MKIKTLVKRALKDGFKGKPAKGYKYLKELENGSLFKTSSGSKGILLDSNINARVIITETPIKFKWNRSKGDKIMEWLVTLTGSLVWIAVSLVIICFCIIAIVTIVENWLANGKFDRFKR